jgi:hypothetical protein
MLKGDSPVAKRAADALMSGVKVVACENTMKARKLVYADMLPAIGRVPAGVVEVMLKQHRDFRGDAGARRDRLPAEDEAQAGPRTRMMPLMPPNAFFNASTGGRVLLRDVVARHFESFWGGGVNRARSEG